MAISRQPFTGRANSSAIYDHTHGCLMHSFYDVLSGIDFAGSVHVGQRRIERGCNPEVERNLADPPLQCLQENVGSEAGSDDLDFVALRHHLTPWDRNFPIKMVSSARHTSQYSSLLRSV